MAVEKFIAGLDLQELFRDKDTGLPLSAGTLTFYKDVDRLTLKPVYKYTGSPGNPAYTALPNPYVLNSAGYATDTIYYFPYDANDDVELYYIEIRNSDNVLQNTREAWPPGFVEGAGGTEISVNYVPNGQFNVWGEPANFVTNSSLINAVNDVVELASGNWVYYQTPGTTTNVDFTFTRFGLNPTPDGNPKFSLDANVTNNDLTDTQRDILVTWNPVNAFSSDINEYTFSFWGKSNLVTNAVVSLRLIKSYGSGGSPDTDEELAQFTLSTSYNQFVHTFTFGDDAAKTLGTGTTQVRLGIRLPLTAITNTSYTNFILTPGDVAQPIFPATTVQQSRRDSYLGTMGDQGDGNKIGLPVIQTRYNFNYDDSYIGSPYPVFRDANPLELLCDGASYFTNDYATTGIPYSRLFGVIGNRFGNGPDFVSSYYYANTEDNHLCLSTNQNGAVAAPANVSASVTVTPIHVSTEDVKMYAGRTFSSTELILISKNYGSYPGAVFGAGTSGFTVTKLSGDFLYDPANDTTGNSRFGYRISVGGLPGAGTYFQFASLIPATTNYYVWYKVDGAGADPAPGGTGIEIDLFTAVDTADSVANKTAMALQSTIQYDIKWTGTPSAGGYWTFDTVSMNYYVWYTVDGSGSDPAIGGRRGIKVAVLSADTTQQIATKTQGAINIFKFAVPDLRGVFLRGFDPNQQLDLLSERFDITQQRLITSNIGLGGMQWPILNSHAHGGTVVNLLAITAGGPTVVSKDLAIAFKGARDTRPWNVTANYVMKY